MLDLIPIAAFTDNYHWLLHDGTRAMVVDPGDAAPVQRALQEHRLRLEAIVVTHHHPDHTGGIHTLREATGARVFGPANEVIPGPLVRLQEGDTLTCLGLPFHVIDLPGHTLGHIAYYTPQVNGMPLLFCGDTLFSGGCGRLFEGTHAQLLSSLGKLAALPGNTRVCCAHEYTLSNLRFARAVEPDNAALVAYEAHCLRLRDQGLPTLPSTIAQELAINPFLRLRQPTVQAAARRFEASANDELSLFTAIRQWKNQFQ